MSNAVLDRARPAAKAVGSILSEDDDQGLQLMRRLQFPPQLCDVMLQSSAATLST